MKKLVFLLILIMGIPLTINAKDTLTITYDANDGSGRTKTVDLPRGDSYTMLGNDVFSSLNDDAKNPHDDKVIKSWNTSPDGSGTTLSIFKEYVKPTGIDYNFNGYNYLNALDDITLYAKWEGRQNIGTFQTGLLLNGEGTYGDSEGNYSIEKNKDFVIQFIFQEAAGKQMGQLPYFELPEFFTSVLSKEIKEELAKPDDLSIRITYSGQDYRYHGSSYIVNDILYFDLRNDGTYSASLLDSTTNLRLNMRYTINYSMKQVYNRMVRVASLQKGTDDSKPFIDIYPKGNITIKYIDADTGKELVDSISSSDIVGTPYIFNKKNINGYKIVEIPGKGKYEYDYDDQTIIIKYRKQAANPINEIITNPKTNTNKYILYTIMLIISISIINMILYYKKEKTRLE